MVVDKCVCVAHFSLSFKSLQFCICLVLVCMLISAVLCAQLDEIDLLVRGV